MHHNLKFAILRYLPNVISDASVAFGILGHEVGTGTFADAKFLPGWEPILRVDPTADIEGLSSLITEIQNEWPDVQNRTILLEMFLDAFSNSVQVQEMSCLTSDPKTEMNILALRYLGT